MEKAATTEGGFHFSASPKDLHRFHMYFELPEEKVQRFKPELALHNGTRFVFSAHEFTEVLIAAGLDQSLLGGCLYNSGAKSGNRLYGTRLYSQRPSAAVLDLGSGASIVFMPLFNMIPR